MGGRLVVVPTPIGNLADITQRALDELSKADVVFAEDTRRTGLLLQHFGIRARLRSLFLGNERERTEEALALLRDGGTVDLVSDAGTPGISDPGADLVAAAISEGCAVEVLPGPQAILPALLLSGLPPAPFTFLGFLPRRRTDRLRAVERLKGLPWTLVIYEAPHRVEATLTDLLEVLGDRGAALAREISKLHEEVRRGSLASVLGSVRDDPPRGEIVLVVGGAAETARADAPGALGEFVHQAILQGLSPREIADAARTQGYARREAYNMALKAASEADSTRPETGYR